MNSVEPGRHRPRIPTLLQVPLGLFAGALVFGIGTFAFTHVPHVRLPAIPVASSSPATYRQVLATDSRKLVTADGTVSTACGAAGTDAECTVALQTHATTSSKYLADLAKHTPPACYRTADAGLRAGLTLMHDADVRLAGAIQGNDRVGINAAIADLNTGHEEYNRAITAAQAAKC